MTYEGSGGDLGGCDVAVVVIAGDMELDGDKDRDMAFPRKILVDLRGRSVVKSKR